MKCPKCKNEMERRKHTKITDKMRKSKYVFSEWDVCTFCHHIQHYEEFKTFDLDKLDTLQTKLF